MEPRNHIPLILLVWLLTVSVTSLPLPAAAAETADYEVVPCQCINWSCMRAFVYDTDPAGTNVRSGPGTDYDIVTTLPSDEPALVTITGSVGEWMRIEYSRDETEPQRTGWVHGSRLSVRVIGTGYGPAPLYSEPDTKSATLAMIPDRTYVTLAGCRAGWINVRYRGLAGWLPAESRGLIETEFEDDCAPAAGAYDTDVPLAAPCDCAVYVAEPDPKGLAVHSGPGDDKPVVKTLPRHTRVYITRSVGEWVRINTITDDGCPGEPIGWTYGHLLAASVRYFWLDDPIPEQDSSENALVFAEPITGSTVVTKIPRDTEVTVLGCWRGFLKVRYNGAEGWLPWHCGDPDMADRECW
jgi:uncharacterized protein YraI